MIDNKIIGMGKKEIVTIVGALMVTMFIRLIPILTNSIPFNSDEAIVALMARHITQGATPIFFYGQAYMGSLDAYLVASGFLLFGEHVWVIRLIQIILYLGVLVTTLLVGKAIFGNIKVGILSMCLLAVPTVNVSLYTTVTLGGYVEMLLLGNLILLTGFLVGRRLKNTPKRSTGSLLFLEGILSGLGFWAFGLTLIYIIPTWLYLIWSYWESVKQTQLQGRLVWHRFSAGLGKGFVISIAGFLLGVLPLISFTLQNGIVVLLYELSGGAIAGVEGLPYPVQILRHAINLIILGSTVILGLRPPWEVRWLALPLIPLVIFIYIGVAVWTLNKLLRRSFERQAEVITLLGVGLILIGGFVLTPFGADPSGRYFLPLSIILALIVADLVIELHEKYGKWAYGLAGILFVFQLWGTVQVATKYPPGITTQFDAVTQIDHRYDQELIDFLLEKGELRGYSNYWVAYPLAFLSQEEILYNPRLPYHQDFRYTERDDRYEPYTIAVGEAEHVAYITTNNLRLESYIRNHFTMMQVTWQEEQIGDYHIFYNLSKVVRPADIELGVTTP